MWVKFNLQGTKIKFKVENTYQAKQIDVERDEVSFSFEFQNVIKYSTNKKEVLLSRKIAILNLFYIVKIIYKGEVIYERIL